MKGWEELQRPTKTQMEFFFKSNVFLDLVKEVFLLILRQRKILAQMNVCVWLWLSQLLLQICFTINQLRNPRNNLKKYSRILWCQVDIQLCGYLSGTSLFAKGVLRFWKWLASKLVLSSSYSTLDPGQRAYSCLWTEPVLHLSRECGHPVAVIQSVIISHNELPWCLKFHHWRPWRSGIVST